MDNALHYLTLNRQISLSTELDVVANNVANLSTVGFRREGVAFTEFVQAAEDGESVSMADSGARYASTHAGVLTLTGGRYDLAIEGEGFFSVQHPEGEMLTRAGGFQLSETGAITTSSGLPLLDTGGAPILVPAGATSVLIGQDGTLSVDGLAIGQIAVVTAEETAFERLGETAFLVPDGTAVPVNDARIVQGALEGSNVNAVFEMSRLIEVTRSYEMAQSIIEDEDERVRQAIQTLGSTQ